MERKLRNRMTKQDVKLTLVKMIPWIFIVLLYLAASSLGTVAGDGPIKSLVD
jgi:hypothetical protein